MCAAPIFAACSGECGPSFLPVKVAAIFAHHSGDFTTVFCQALIFALVASEITRPRPLADILSRVLSEIGCRAIAEAAILARDSSENMRPLSLALSFARLSGRGRYPTLPSPPQV